MEQHINIQQSKDLNSALAMEPFHERGHKKSANPEVVSVIEAVESTRISEYRSYHQQGQGSDFSYPGRRMQTWRCAKNGRPTGCFPCFELAHFQNDGPKQAKAFSETDIHPADEKGDHVNDLN
jgi:hypothetical protein